MSLSPYERRRQQQERRGSLRRRGWIFRLIRLIVKEKKAR